MSVNLKELIEGFYWRNNSEEYVRVSGSAYKTSLLIADFNRFFKERTPVDLDSNHNDRSVRLTYCLKDLFKQGEVLMASHQHGIDAVVCHKNNRGEIIDENKNVIPNDKLDNYVNDCLKQKSGLIKLNMEYKTMLNKSVMPETFVDGLIWFSNIKPTKEMPAMDCFVYSMLKRSNQFVQFTFVITNKKDMEWFNDLLQLIRTLYGLLYKFGNAFTNTEVLIGNRKKKNKFVNENKKEDEDVIKLVSDFDCTDMFVWMLYKCNVFYQTKIINDKAQWNSSEIPLCDALINTFEYFRLQELVDSLDEQVKNSFDDYIAKYENKIAVAQSYLIGRSSVLFKDNPIEKAKFDKRINDYINILNNALNKLKEHLIKKNPDLIQTKQHKIKK